MTRDPALERDHFEDVLARRGVLYWAERTAAGRRRREVRALMLLAAAQADGRALRRVLEIGCGTGDFTRALAPRTDARVVSVDIVPLLLARAQQRNPPNASVAAANVEAVPFATGAFDAVVGNSVLHHLRLDRAIPELLRVLRPGGRFVFSEPNMLNPQVFLERNVRWIGRLLDNSPGETAFVRWRLARLLVRLGLDDVLVRPFDFLYPLTPRPLIGIVERLGHVFERVPGIAEIAGSVFISGRKPGG